MADPDLPSLRLPSPERRELVVQELSSAFAAGRLEVEELEQRMEMAYRAQTLAELDAAMAGLAPMPSAATAEVAEPRVPAPAFRADRPKPSRHSIAIMSATVREGRWVPARVHRGWILMAGTKLDFREAELETGVTEVRLNVLMGGVEVIVPPDLDVELDGFAIMGAIDRRHLHPAPLETQTKRPRIRARVLMGAVEVKVKS